MKTKILHIAHDASYNGATIYISRLCTQLNEFEQEIVFCFDGIAYNIISKLTNCENLLSSKHMNYKFLLLKYWKFFRFIRKRNYDIIHYHQGGIGILLLAFFFRKKAVVIHHLHSGNLIGDNTKHNISFLHTLLLKYLSLKTYQIAVADHVAKEYSLKIGSTGNLLVIKNSKPFAFQHKNKINKAIGFIGRCTKEKGFTLLSGIAKKLDSTDSQVKLIIMGEEPENFTTESKEENVNFIKPSFEVEKFYCSIDLLLFLSTAPEGMPLVVLEAVSFDIGIIAFALQGVKEILGENYPLLVNNSEDIINKISLYFSGEINIERLNAVHKQVSEEYNESKMHELIQEVYNKIIK